MIYDYSFTFAGAGEESRDIPAGNHVRILEATGDVYLAINNGPFRRRTQGWAETVEPGGAPITKITVKSLIAQSILIGAGRGETDDGETLNVNVTATVTPGNTIGAGGDVALPAGVGGATTLVSAADATALTVLLKADIANTETIRVGGAGVGAAGGYPLEPGESVSLSTTAAIWAYNPSAVAAQNIHVLPMRSV
jgi:hypothetical protein